MVINAERMFSDPPPQPVLYELLANVEHLGASSGNGHYVTHVRTSTDVCHTYDDGSFKEVGRILTLCRTKLLTKDMPLAKIRQTRDEPCYFSGWKTKHTCVVFDVVQSWLWLSCFLCKPTA